MWNKTQCTRLFRKYYGHLRVAYIVLYCTARAYKPIVAWKGPYRSTAFCSRMSANESTCTLTSRYLRPLVDSSSFIKWLVSHSTRLVRLCCIDLEIWKKFVDWWEVWTFLSAHTAVTGCTTLHFETKKSWSHRRKESHKNDAHVAYRAKTVGL